MLSFQRLTNLTQESRKSVAAEWLRLPSQNRNEVQTVGPSRKKPYHAHQPSQPSYRSEHSHNINGRTGGLVCLHSTQFRFDCHETTLGRAGFLRNRTCGAIRFRFETSWRSHRINGRNMGNGSLECDERNAARPYDPHDTGTGQYENKRTQVNRVTPSSIPAASKPRETPSQRYNQRGLNKHIRSQDSEAVARAHAHERTHLPPSRRSISALLIVALIRSTSSAERRPPSSRASTNPSAEP